jgi:tetratricopeptide (TPR) repeat protein
MLRLAPAGAWVLALAVAACGAPPAPAPVKVTESPTPLKRAPAKKDGGPFYNPDKEPPPPRSEPQQPADELAATLAAAEAARKVGDEAGAALALRACANKVPQSVRCEGELASLLAKSKRHKYEARYYLEQSVAGDDPALPPAHWKQLASALRDKGMYKEAIVAMQRAVERSAPATGEDWMQLSEALQMLPERVVEAADAAHRAYELEPTRHDWLRTEAVLLGQVPDKFALSLARFTEYREKVKDPQQVAEVDRRIADLKALMETPPTPAPEKREKGRPGKPGKAGR